MCHLHDCRKYSWGCLAIVVHAIRMFLAFVMQRYPYRDNIVVEKTAMQSLRLIVLIQDDCDRSANLRDLRSLL